MKIMILCGHGKDGNSYDPGASGCGYREAEETIRYGNLIAKHLRAFAEVDVYEGNLYHYLFEAGGTFDFTGYDYVLECHLNAAANPAGHGTEIFVTTYEKEITVEQAIMKRLSKYFTLRDNDAVMDGVKRYNWGVIHAIKTQDKVSGALLELCFITNQADMDTYEQNLEAICQDIAQGIAEGFQLSQKDPVKVPDNAPESKPVTDTKKSIEQIAREVMNGAWGNGSDRANRLMAAGYDYQAVQTEVNKLYGMNTLSGSVSKPHRQIVTLPASAASWRVYKTNVAPVVGNECGKLNPALFGGLTYEILASPMPHVVTIQTRDFGRVNIYVGTETGAIIR